MIHRDTIDAERQAIRNMLKRWYFAEDLQTVLWLAQQHGIRIRAVRRMQLGKPSDPDFGAVTETTLPSPGEGRAKER